MNRNTPLLYAGKSGRVQAVSISMDQPNPIKVAWRIFRVTRSGRRPIPTGIGSVDHSQFSGVLEALAEGGLPALAARDRELSSYMAKMATVDPDTLSRDEAITFWLNLYNAGALRLSVRAWETGEESVLRVPGGFDHKIIEVSGEELSLDVIEHAKIRRFGDPRIHGALVCGSVSCPTLRSAPYTGENIDSELEEQMSHFLRHGGAVKEGVDGIKLSRVFLWFGSDFARPHRMPTFLPGRKKAIISAVEPWLPEELAGRTKVSFQPYDWGLRCAIG
jgi:hypothetical protein